MRRNLEWFPKTFGYESHDRLSRYSQTRSVQTNRPSQDIQLVGHAQINIGKVQSNNFLKKPKTSLMSDGVGGAKGEELFLVRVESIAPEEG